MIAPDKYVKTSNSILGQAAEVLALRENEMTVSSLWDKVREREAVSYERFVLCLDFLYIVGLLDLREGTLAWRQ